jgi:hypothetical protein
VAQVIPAVMNFEAAIKGKLTMALPKWILFGQM